MGNVNEVGAKIESDSRVKVLAKPGDRWVLQMDLALCVRCARILKVRAQQPTPDAHKAFDENVKEEGLIYRPQMFVDCSGSTPVYYLWEGEQRFRALEAAKSKTVVVDLWLDLTEEKALKLAVAANFHRFEAVEADLLSLIDAGITATAELEKLTGKGKKTIENAITLHKSGLAKFVKTETNKEGLFNASYATKLLKSAKDDSAKVTAIIKAVENKAVEAKAEISAELKRAAENNEKVNEKKTDLKSYFTDSLADTWKANLVQGKTELTGESKELFDPIDFGDAEAWKKGVPNANIVRVWSKFSDKNLNELLAWADMLKEEVQIQLAARAHDAAREVRAARQIKNAELGVKGANNAPAAMLKQEGIDADSDSKDEPNMPENSGAVEVHGGVGAAENPDPTTVKSKGKKK